MPKLSFFAWLALSLLMSALAPQRPLTADALQADPIEWSQPDTRPPFRELIRGDTFRQQLESCLRQVGPVDDPGRWRLPPQGLRVLAVKADSQAERLGIRPDDVFAQVDDRPLWSIRQAWAPRDKPRNVRVFTVAGEQQNVTFHPGGIGVSVEEHWRPLTLYINGPQRNSTYDKFVIAGIRACSDRPDFAETCWHHAVGAGYPRDSLSAQCGAEIAYRQLRTRVAADFACFALQSHLEHGDVVHPRLLYLVAIANYKWKAARELAKRSPGEFSLAPESYAALIEMHESRPADERRAPPTSEPAAAWYRDDLIPRCWDSDVCLLLRLLRKQNNVRLESQPDHYKRGILVPEFPARNVELIVHFRVDLKPGMQTSYARVFEFGLVDRDRQFATMRSDRRSAAVAIASLEADGTLRLQYHNQPQQIFPGWRDSGWGGDLHKFRVVRVGGQAQIFYQNQQILHVPVHRSVDSLACYLQEVGSRVDIQHIEFNELIERR